MLLDVHDERGAWRRFLRGPLGTEPVVTTSLRFWLCPARRISNRQIQMKPPTIPTSLNITSGSEGGRLKRRKVTKVEAFRLRHGAPARQVKRCLRLVGPTARREGLDHLP